MRVDITFYEPHQHAKRRLAPAADNPFVAVNTVGRFRFNDDAVTMLGLKRGSQVALGQSDDDLRDWFVTVGQGAALHQDVNGGLYFCSQALRQRLLAVLPFAPPARGLVFKLDTISIPADAARPELWPLLTACYWQQPEAAPKPTSPNGKLHIIGSYAFTR